VADWRSEIRQRLAHARLSPARESEVVEELAQYVQDRYDELVAAGEDEATARAAALDECDDADAWPPEREVVAIPMGLSTKGATMRSMLWQDVRYALRTLRKAPGFSTVVIVTLALGIGATTAIFSVLDGVLIRPLPYPDVARILTLTQRTTAGASMSVSWHDFQDWRTQNQVFEYLGVYRPTTTTLTGGDQPERLVATLASSESFGATGLPPLAGRVFGAAEDRPGTELVAVVSERLWRNRFGADPALVGRAITLNGQPYIVIGIMPASMRFPSRLTDVWLPLGTAVPGFPPRGAHPGLIAIGKMKSGVSLQQAIADMDTIALRLAQQYPDSNKNTRVAIVPYYEQVVRNIRPALITLITAVGFVLLIACANLANLMLSKAEGRRREIAIRAALGAERRRIVQQLLVESLLLAGTGGAIGAVLAWWAVKAFVASQPTTVPRIDLLAVDARVLVFTAAISILTGVVFGLVPALRTSSLDLLTHLKDSARGFSLSSQRVRSTLVVVEVAMTIVLLIGAGLMARSFTRLMAIDPGFNRERVITVRVSLPDAKYPGRNAWTIFHRELLRRVAALPGIDSVGLNSAVPLEGGGFEAPVIAEGDPMPSAERPATSTLFQTTSPDYFRAMGIQLLAGRTFTERDTAETTPVVVVDESLVRKLFPQTDPIGKRIAFEFNGHSASDQHPTWREIVGVVRHVRHYGIAREPPFVQLYTPFEQLPRYMQPRGPAMALMARTALEPDLLAAAIRREIAAIDPNIPIYGLQTMERLLAQNTEQPRLTVMLLAGFGALALMLALVGIYGVLSYTVSSRTQEIGIRLALGATRGDVVRMVVGHGMRLACIGAVIGLAASLGLAQSMRALLSDLSPHDPATYVGMVIVIAAVALLASYLPARRATRVDPLQALRAE
jgi:putative ABC transport system permease protein